MTMETRNLEPDNQASAASGRSGPSVALILAAVLVAASVIFVLRNSTPVKLDFMVFTWTTTVRWAIFISIVLGALLDTAFGLWWRRRKKNKIKNKNQ